MSRSFPEVPQTGRQAMMLRPEQEKRLLSMRVAADRSDPFATDTNEYVRALGKLALRRKQEDPNDSFALGDLCAALSLTDENLLILYVGKAMLAYRRALQQSTGSADQKVAAQAIDRFVRWVMEIAAQAPTLRNLAVALWAASEIPVQRQAVDFSDMAIKLAGQYAASLVRPESALPLLPVLQETVEDRNLALQALDPPQEPEASESRLAERVELLDTRPDIFDTQVGNEDDYSPDSAYNARPRETQEMEKIAPPASLDMTESPSMLPTLFQERSRSLMISPSPAADDPEKGDPGDFWIGDNIANRYEVRSVIRGGMGIIYLCFDHEARSTVAIKTFQGRFLENQRAMSRFIQEARTWIKLEKHNNIVQARLVKEMGNERVRERPHIVLEYVAGPEGLGSDLKSWIDHNRLDLPTTLRIGLDICLGMQHAVERVPGLVHRDLKPANILVRHDGVAKVTDFGLAHSLDTLSSQPDAPHFDDSAPGHLTRAGAVVGTAPYMSPEQCRGETVDLRADLYAFGAILFEMLTRRQLFEVRTFDDWMDAHLTLEPHFPTEVAGHLNGDLVTLVLNCLSKQPEDRPADWTTLADQLADLYQVTTGQPAMLDTSGESLEARDLMDQAYSLTELNLHLEALDAHDRALELSPKSPSAWTSKGRTLRLLNRYEEALTCYEKALLIDPSFAWAWRSKGIILERQEKYEEALAAYQQASALRPADIWPVYYQAGVLRDLNRHDEALQKLDDALTIDPQHVMSHARRGQVLRAMEKYEEALSAYDEALALDPNDGSAWDGKGLTLKALKRPADAASAFMQATRLLPRRYWPWEHLAEALFEQQRYADALPVIQQAMRLATTLPTQAMLWARQGQLLRQLQRYDEGLQAYDHALELQPDYARAYSGKGAILERLGKLTEALACFKQASEYDVQDAWPHYNQGNILSALGRYDEAISQFKCTVKLDRQHSGGWAAWGNALRRQGKPEKALNYYNKALTLDPTYAWAWNEKAVALEMLKRYDEALLAYLKAIDSASHEPLYRFNLADTLITLERYEEALSTLEQIIEIEPQYYRAWARMGQMQRKLNRYDEAIKSYLRALEIDPHYAAAWNGQGLALSALNRHDEALTCFKRASEEDPTDVWYWYSQADELLTLDHYGSALDVLDRALKLDETHVESWAKRGQALRRLGRFKEALVAYDRALALNPHYAWAWNGRGLALEQMKRREEAILSYERAAHEDPTSLWYWLNQLDPLLELGRRDDALNVCEQAIDALPTAAIPWARKGQVLRRLDRHAEALDAYERALQLDPTYAWAWNGKGLAYAVLNRWEEALVCYDHAIQEDSSDVWFWHNRGEALINLGRFDEGIRALNRALEIDPHHKESHQKRIEARKKRHESDDD